MVISGSIGYLFDEKMSKVLQSYFAKDMYLIGSFLNEKLIEVIGFQILEYSITIRHVLKNHRRTGIGTLLVQYLMQNFKLKIKVETDSSAIEFYSKLGFSYKKFIENILVKNSKSFDTYGKRIFQLKYFISIDFLSMPI